MDWTPRAGDALLIERLEAGMLAGPGAIAGAERLLPVANRYLSEFQVRHLPVLATRERGASVFAPGLGLPAGAVAVETPGGGMRSSFDGTTLGQSLRELGVRRLFVGGLPTEDDVLATVRDALRRGFEVALLVDALCAAERLPGDGAVAVRAMCQLGAHAIHIGELAERPAAAAKSPREGVLEFLRDPRHYPEGTRSVRAVETHMSWVFLTDTRAWKLKKPEHLDGIDLATPAARAAHLRMELRLNRRFGGDAYLDVVALRAGPHGLAFGAEGPAVEWLLRMRRLPEALMLPALIASGSLRRRDVRAIASLLARFHATCAPEPLSATAYRLQLLARIATLEHALQRHAHHLPPGAPAELARRQRMFLQARAALFDARVDAGRIVEGHGDLRPEHVCLEVPPILIDCLEFSRELRITDGAAELAFLALECERLGCGWFRDEAFGAYAKVANDDPDPSLVDFHQSLHACARAWLALRHLEDSHPRDPARWPALAADYLRLASARISCTP